MKTYEVTITTSLSFEHDDDFVSSAEEALEYAQSFLDEGEITASWFEIEVKEVDSESHTI